MDTTYDVERSEDLSVADFLDRMEKMKAARLHKYYVTFDSQQLVDIANLARMLGCEDDCILSNRPRCAALQAEPPPGMEDAARLIARVVTKLP